MKKNLKFTVINWVIVAISLFMPFKTYALANLDGPNPLMQTIDAIIKIIGFSGLVVLVFGIILKRMNLKQKGLRIASNFFIVLGILGILYYLLSIPARIFLGSR